jgi:3-oxoacyl-[acyl-carrier-protein] synthase I
MARRVVITGRGIVSCIGNTVGQVAAALRQGKCGIERAREFAEAGLRSEVAGMPCLDGLPAVERKLRRFMPDAALYAYHAARAAIAEARLGPSELAGRRTGLIVGSGSSPSLEMADNVALARSQGARKVPPYAVPRLMGNTASANLASAFGIQGPSYSIVSACATSSHCIGHGAELIQLGKLDRVIAGGADEVRWTTALMFDAMRALSSHYNDRPHAASRPYDSGRDGFVLAGGAGIVVLEELESALARGARPLAELVGYGASSDGGDMVVPSPAGIAHALRAALDEAGLSSVDYVNTHATGTAAGDIAEVQAMSEVFGDAVPPFSSTKGLTGHAVAASGAQEAIYCLLMIEQGFIAGCTNLAEPDPAVREMPIVRATRGARLGTVMSNSLGFGGTNACLILRQWRGAPG